MLMQRHTQPVPQPDRAALALAITEAFYRSGQGRSIRVEQGIFFLAADDGSGRWLRLSTADALRMSGATEADAERWRK